MSRHRQPVKPRWGRLVLVLVTLMICGVASGAGVALWRESGANAGAANAPVGSAPSQSPTPSPTTGTGAKSADDTADPATGGTGEPSETGLDGSGTDSNSDSSPGDVALPPNSGTGLRVVFSESRQRVWLVGAGGVVERTYLGSGSAYDNLFPGTYEVYSRSEQAYAVDGSQMQYFVRFTEGTNGGAIGFHTIPTLRGEPLQTKAQLGQPLSHGCIRQDISDALAMWAFAPIGTTVVVTV